MKTSLLCAREWPSWHSAVDPGDKIPSFCGKRLFSNVGSCIEAILEGVPLIEKFGTEVRYAPLCAMIGYNIGG